MRSTVGKAEEAKVSGVAANGIRLTWRIQSAMLEDRDSDKPHVHLESDAEQVFVVDGEAFGSKPELR